MSTWLKLSLPPQWLPAWGALGVLLALQEQPVGGLMVFTAVVAGAYHLLRRWP